ncbi:MAG: sugar phosphate isomerase/epimerase, partial [Candidatus Omnitrophica bacterium]|nr:sugar phosphate isomerase/epimerase [Candidatus Omnitrophota bacterium]
PESVPREKTIEQIGRSLRQVAAFAADYGVKIRLEVHGAGTCHPPYIKQMVEIADHPNCYVCWNSNQADRDENGSIDKNFDLLADKIDIVHINELSNDYPWIRLFCLLQKRNFQGYCLAEVGASPEPERFFLYYRALFDAYCRLALGQE